jgi:hypothetical protein
LRRIFTLIALSGLLISCGGGGGGGGGGTPAASGTTVSGSVQAPNGQIAFAHPQGFIEQVANLLTAEAYASLSGLSPVPDGTQVQLARLNASGTGFTVLATTSTVGGTYSFNLTALGLQVSNDLIVRVVNGAVQMRGFVTGSHVNLDPVAESSVRLVLGQLGAIPGGTLGLFTVQELADITGSINVLVTANQLGAGTNVETTVTSILSATTANAGLMAFITAAAGNGQTTLGPGDIGNYVPLTQGNFWEYQGTKSDTGSSPQNYQNTVRVNGTNMIGTVSATVLTESNPDGSGVAQDEYVFKDSVGLTEYGNTDTTDTLTPHLVPFPLLRFPLAPGSSFTQLNRSGVDYGQDLDGDGRNEVAAVNSNVSVIGTENVTVPVGSFTNAVKIQTVITITVTFSSDGSKATVTETDTRWLAPGVGPVKDMTVTQGQGITETVTEVLAAYVADGQGGGIRIQVTPTSLTTQVNFTKPLQATAFDQTNTPIPGVVFTWTSTNTGIAQVGQDGTVTGIAPGTASVTASADGFTSNTVQVTVNDVRILSLTTNGIIYDKFRQKIYASIPSTATSNPNSITVIDPVTLSIGPSVPVGSEPTKLAISDDGQVLYVGLDGEGAVQQVSLSSFTAGPKFSLGAASAACGIPRAFDLQVLPGSPQSVAIILLNANCIMFTVAVYDNGVQRPNTTPANGPQISSLAFSQISSILYGLDSIPFSSLFVTMAVDSQGVSITNTTSGLIPGGQIINIKFDAGRIYSDNGAVVDPVSRTLVGTFQLTATSLVKPDSSLGRVFFVSGNDTSYTVLVFDINSLNLIGSMPVDGITGGPPIGPPGIDSFIRWGTDGVAFRSGSQVAFVRTSSIQ